MKSMNILKSKILLLIVLAALLLSPHLAHAQATSRVIPFNNLVSNYPRKSAQGGGDQGDQGDTNANSATTRSVIVQLWDAATAGNLIFFEAQPNASVDANGNLSFVFGSQTTNGLDPNNFSSGTSRYLDVIDSVTQLSVLANGRIALSATAFALSPGPEGPQGPAGPQGSPGLVQTVRSGDASITIAGSPASPAVAVAANGITNANVANGALSPLKITGTAATLGANTYLGSQTVNGDLSSTGNLVTGDSTATTGNVLKGGALFIHNFGVDNTFIGKGAGNLTTTGFGGNTAMGASALQSNTTGFSNTAIGANVLQLNTTGIGNTAVGSAVLNEATSSFNTAIGAFVLQSDITGDQNTAIGYAVLPINTTGSNNTATGSSALESNGAGNANTASGSATLPNNTTGNYNTANGYFALFTNTTGSFNTAIGNGADVASGDLTNATAIGNGAIVDASNKIRLGNAAVTVIEAQVGLTVISDRNKKENFRALNGEDVLRKIRGINVMSWNYIGHDPRQFRHYGPMAQEFFAAFGHDGMGTIGTDTTINSSDLEGILTISVQALEKRSQDLQAENAALNKKIDAMEAENVDLRVRLETLERRLANLKGTVDH